MAVLVIGSVIVSMTVLLGLAIHLQTRILLLERRVRQAEHIATVAERGLMSVARLPIPDQEARIEAELTLHELDSLRSKM